MSSISDLDSLMKHLREKGQLATQLSPQDFAPEDSVAYKMARQFKDMNPTQMRKVFHTFKRIERSLKGKRDADQLSDELLAEISLLGPELAYAVGRELIPKEFYTLLKTCLHRDKMQTVGDFRVLTQLLTAILAYQKYYQKDKESGGQND